MGQFETGGARHAFLYSEGKYVQLDFPGTGAEGTVTFAWGINNRGDIVGRFNLGRGDGPHGFLFSGGQWKRIDHPESQISAVNGINQSGEMVGIWFDANQNEHSFRLNDGRFTSIDIANATRTLVDALLDSGAVSGTYRDKSGVSRGYVMDRSGCVTTIDADKYPGVTVARGINALGLLVGQYTDANKQRGYILRGYPLQTCKDNRPNGKL